MNSISILRSMVCGFRKWAKWLLSYIRDKTDWPEAFHYSSETLVNQHLYMVILRREDIFPFLHDLTSRFLLIVLVFFTCPMSMSYIIRIEQTLQL